MGELVLLEMGRKEIDQSRIEAIRRIAGEAFVPISYGGGIREIGHIRTVVRSGFEKVVMNTALHETPQLAREAALRFGAQAVVASMEVARGLFGRERVCTNCGRRQTSWRPVDWAQRCEELNCGEILLTSIDRDGYELDLVEPVSVAVSVPVIALGGAGLIQHLQGAISAGASAVAAGSMFVHFGSRRAVLIDYPGRLDLPS